MSEKWLRTLIVNGKQSYIIVDYIYWGKNEKELVAWLDENTKVGRDTQEGMTLNFADEQEELMFILRWGR